MCYFFDTLLHDINPFFCRFLSIHLTYCVRLIVNYFTYETCAKEMSQNQDYDYFIFFIILFSHVTPKFLSLIFPL